MSGLLHADSLSNRAQILEPQVGHGFMGLFDGFGVQFQPAGIGQFDKSAGGGREALEIGGSQLKSLGLPFGGNREPINAAAFNDELRPQLARGQEKPVKGWVAQIFGQSRFIRPGQSECAQESFIGVAYPDANFGCEPIQSAQPLHGGFQPCVFEDFRFVLFLRLRGVKLPFLAGPMPEALVSFAPRQQSQPYCILVQLEDKLRLRGVGDAELFPVDVVSGLSLAQIGSQAVA